MNRNIKIQLNEISRLMNYNRSKTLIEQESIFTQQLYNPNYGTLSKKDTAEKWYEEMDFENWTAHGMLETAELVTGLIGMVPFPPLAVAGNLASMGFGLTNAGLYAYEGKPYDATIAASFALIPGPETMSMIKQIKNVDGVVSVGGKPVLNKMGKEVIEQGVKSSWKVALKKSLEIYAKKNGLEKTLKYVLGVSRIINKPIRVYLSIIGFPIAADTLYYLFTLAMTDDKQLTAQQQREKSDFKPVVDFLKSPKEQIKLAIALISMLVGLLTEEDVEGLDLELKDDSMFQEVTPALNDKEHKESMDRLFKKYSEKTD
jgi:hypothetical protein